MKRLKALIAKAYYKVFPPRVTNEEIMALWDAIDEVTRIQALITQAVKELAEAGARTYVVNTKHSTEVH